MSTICRDDYPPRPSDNEKSILRAGSRAEKTARAGRPSLEEAARLRRHILEVALEQFCTDTPERVTMADVARSAQVSKRTLYSRFENKDALLLAAVEHGVETLVSPISINVPLVSMGEQLQFISLHMVEASLRPEVLALERMLSALAIQNPSVFAGLFAPLQRARLAPFQETFDSAMQRGEIGERPGKILAPIAFDILVLQLRSAIQQDPGQFATEVKRVEWLKDRVALIMHGALAKTL